MTEEMDLNENLEDIDEELIEDNNQMETKIVFQNNLPKNNRQISEEELHSMYHSFDINFDELNRRYSLWRLDVIHVRGVQSMSSEEVLKYFEDFEPNSIEWVNDLSCNVVFSDYKSSAIAMRGLTTALVIKAGKQSVKSDLTIDVIDADSLSVPVPPGFRWRLGLNHNKSKAILFRFATNSDKKVKNSRSMSEYYAKYGVPADNGHISDRKRQRINSDSEEEPFGGFRDSAFELKSKRIRMRMRADDELELIRQRLNNKTAAFGAEQRPQNNRNQRKQKKSIWERLDNDSFGAVDTELLQIEIDNQTNSRQTLWTERPLRSTISVVGSKKNTFYNKNDLRTKLSKRKSY